MVLASLGEERLKYLTEDQKIMSSIPGYGLRNIFFKFALKTRVVKNLVLINNDGWAI